MIIKESSTGFRCEGAIDMREVRNKSSRKRLVAIVALTLGLTAAYVLSFFAVRKPFSVTVDLSFNRLTCCYFAKTPIINKVAYWAYLPCIVASGGIAESTIKDRPDAIDAALKRKAVYFYEPPKSKGGSRNPVDISK